MAGLYALLGVQFESMHRLSLLSLYGLTFFFSNYGPNSTVSAFLKLRIVHLFDIYPTERHY
jgi:hypothetical protein